MLRDFIAIDFETANQQPSSVCSVGVVMVRDGQIVDSFYSLIQPEPNYYNYWCQRVHGILQDDTDEAPVFSKVWQQLEERIVEVFFSDKELDDITLFQGYGLVACSDASTLHIACFLRISFGQALTVYYAVTCDADILLTLSPDE